MKKLLLLLGMMLTFFACKKEDNKRTVTNYNQSVEGMGFSYNKAYTFFFQRKTAYGTTTDSDFIIFRTNATITEVSNRFDSGSYVFPDSLTYDVSISYDNSIYWNYVPNTKLFNFFPVLDGKKGFLLHDYLNDGVVSVYRASGSPYNLINYHPTVKDSFALVTGFIK